MSERYVVAIHESGILEPQRREINANDRITAVWLAFAEWMADECIIVDDGARVKSACMLIDNVLTASVESAGQDKGLHVVILDVIPIRSGRHGY